MKAIWTIGYCAVLAALAARAEDAVVDIRIDPQATVGKVAEDFIGFGYETSSVAQPNFFTGANTTLIRLYDDLTPHGLMRIGGNVSDHTRFEPNGTAVAKTERDVTVINEVSLKNLGDFARTTGWRVMWGLNLGTGTKEEAVQEAVAVDAALGASLQSFEIGNEVDALRRFSHNYDAYHAAFLEYKAAIRAALPNAKFSGPDVIGNWHWITNFARSEAGDMQLLTQHYYRGGAGNSNSTLARLLLPDEGWTKRLEELRTLCQEEHLAFRINEVNSYSGGGKAGVSDTFGSALWVLDYMFKLAAHGCEGVNIETDINQLGFISHYSPIVHDAAWVCSARPEYYGMQAFAMAGKGEMLRLNVSGGDPSFTTYGTKASDGVIWVAAINKSASKDRSVKLHDRQEAGTNRYAVWRLTGPSLESKRGVTFGKAENLSNESTHPKELTNEVWDSTTELTVPAASAALIRISH